jgi:hypothetical protein
LSASRFRLTPSPALASAIFIAHLAAGIATYLVLGGLAAVLLALALAALGAAAAWSRALLGAPRSVRVLELDAQPPLFELTNGEKLAAPIGARRYVSRYIVALSLGRPVRRTLLVSRDMLSAEEFRRLRLWALWGKLPRVARGQLPA